MRTLVVWLINALSLLAVPYVLPSVSVDSIYAALVTALLLGLINTLIRPLLVLITLPITILTLGLFTLVINAGVLKLVSWLIPAFHIEGFWTAIGGAVVLSIVSALLNLTVLYEDLGEFEKASACVDKVLEAHPNHLRANLFHKDVESSKIMFYDEEKEKKKSRKNQILETPISDFELSVRSRNCLRKMNLRTLGDLLNITEAELLSYKNFGETSLREIKVVLEQKGLHLGQALEDKQLQPDEPEPQGTPEDRGLLNKSVDDLQLSVRARKCLQKLNLRTLGELTRTTDAELLGCKNFGVTSLNEIKRMLSGCGLSLRSLD